VYDPHFDGREGRVKGGETIEGVYESGSGKTEPKGIRAKEGRKIMSMEEGGEKCLFTLRQQPCGFTMRTF